MRHKTGLRLSSIQNFSLLHRIGETILLYFCLFVFYYLYLIFPYYLPFYLFVWLCVFSCLFLVDQHLLNIYVPIICFTLFLVYFSISIYQHNLKNCVNVDGPVCRPGLGVVAGVPPRGVSARLLTKPHKPHRSQVVRAVLHLLSIRDIGILLR